MLKLFDNTKTIGFDRALKNVVSMGSSESEDFQCVAVGWHTHARVKLSLIHI